MVLAENPFYATGGGQVADEGWISSDDGQLEVFDVVPAGDYQVLRARVERDGFAVGDAVTASINRVRRQQIEANHTATHILHWALRAELGQEVVQAGSYVGPDRLRFDYRYGGKVSEEQIAAGAGAVPAQDHREPAGPVLHDDAGGGARTSGR